MLTSRWLPILACAVLGLTPAGFAQGWNSPVRLVAPQAGTTLLAGSTAELEWTPLAAFSPSEEWEAFLSLDGGATYPVRITPHLDQDLRRVRFQVPAIPTARGRILLRFGDERRETAVELPERFAIAAAPAFLPALGGGFTLARRAAAPGETALPGHAGVVAWTEGSRRGGELRQVVAAEPPVFQARLDPPAAHDEAAVLASGPSPPPSPDAVPGNGAAAVPPAGCRVALSPAGTGPGLAHDILLLTQRQNE